MRKLLALLVTTVVALGAGGACSEGDADPTGGGDGATTTERADDPGPTGADATSEDPDAGDGEGSGNEDGSGGSGEEEADALASDTADLAADPTDPTPVAIRLDVVGLERVGAMVELRVVLTHEGGRTDPPFRPFAMFDDPRLSEGQGQYSLSGAMLIDPDAEQGYLTIIDSEGTCLCTGSLDALTLEPGASREMEATFGSVPDDLEQVGVQVPGFSTFDAVPIS